MANQYAWYPVMRFIPQAGAEEILVLYEAFSDTGGPVKVNPDHVPDMEERVDSQRRSVIRGFGFKPTCTMTFNIVDMQTQAYLQAMVTRLIDQDNWTCYLSLDDGVTYREVVLSKWAGPDPLQGKTFAGASYTITVKAVEVVEEVPLIGTGTW